MPGFLKSSQCTHHERVRCMGIRQLDEEKLVEFVPDEVTIHVDSGNGGITERIC
ncbi:hypothetical protein [Okeania sp. SIO2C9]|uniref:hypothetical protein n=1 Tax=Okeania sp. SIO2C9 TaxID=2607791 RepID=UPI0025D828A7|nr:hypothetical protein [Okeania sp. SIO2C9]